jgi:hypothetical protein
MLYPIFYFLSSLKPRRIRAEDHSNYSSERCLITSKLSKPLYRINEYICENIAVPVDKVNSIVTSRGIPLVRITRLPRGTTKLKVVLYTLFSRFVVISHV